MKTASVLKKILSLVLAAAMLLCLPGCALFENKIEEMTEQEAAPYRELAEPLVQKLFSEDYIGCHGLFGESLSEAKSRSALQEEWEQVRLTFGNPVGVERYDASRINGEATITAQVAMTHGACSVWMTYDKNDELVALWFVPGDGEAQYTIEPPQGVVETELTLGQGTDYPLRAILSMPEAAKGVPCVVLVHDAGAYDCNSALGGSAIFADLAHGLAQQGIACLRYDKRTYAHGDSFDEEQVMQMTVREETIADALLAIEAADALQEVESVWVAGHGLGGTLAPRIAKESAGKADGVISLGGTARGYLDMVYEQSLAMTNEADHKNALKKEYKKVEKLDELKDNATVFGLPVPYLKDLYANPVSAQLDELTIPVLVLHGKNDFQYSLSDYKSWQSALDGYAGEQEMVLFETLNHLFVDNTSLKRRGTTAEYLAEAHIAQEVVDRIAEFVKEH